MAVEVVGFGWRWLANGLLNYRTSDNIYYVNQESKKYVYNIDASIVGS